MERSVVSLACMFASCAVAIAAPANRERPVLSTPPSIGEIATNRTGQLKSAGYVEQEFFVEGVAHSYVKGGEWTSDGLWNVSTGDTAPYKIRMVVRYPAQANRFNGTVFVEWMNVSGGGEGDPNFTVMQEELLRGGYAYVGVGAQAVGVYGPGGLKKVNAERYASLAHPGDSYSYDIFSQAGRLIRSPDGVAPLGPLTRRIRHLLADGESQSASRMVTYVNAVHPVALVYDGFFLHSRSGGGAALAQGKDNKPTQPVPAPSRIRSDLKIPVFVIQTETDVPNFVAARQPDTARLRVWELAGTAHADVYLLTGGKTRPLTTTCDDKDSKLVVPVNDGPMTYPMRAALRHMQRWLTEGVPPPGAGPLVTEGQTIRRDAATGIALGGVRTPEVDVPVRTLNGIRAPAGGGAFCFLFGRTDEWNGDADPWDGGPADPSPTPEPVLSRMYPTKAAFMSKFEQAISAGVKSGFLLKDDVSALRAEAEGVQLEPQKPTSAAHANRLLNTTLNVRDLTASLRFFVEGLGMHERGRHVPSAGVVEVSIGYTNEPQRAELMLAHRSARTTPYGPSEWGRVILEVQDVRATVARVAQAGGKVLRSPGDVASAPVIVAVVEDPDGHQFELVQFK